MDVKYRRRRRKNEIQESLLSIVALPSFFLDEHFNRKFDSKAKWVGYDVVSHPCNQTYFHASTFIEVATECGCSCF